MLARKSTNYRLHMAGITQNALNALFSLWSLKAGKTLNRLDRVPTVLENPGKSWNLNSALESPGSFNIFLKILEMSWNFQNTF